MVKWNFTQGYQSTIGLDLHLSKWQNVSLALAAVLMILLVVAIFILCICIKERVRERHLQEAELQITRARQPTVAQKVASFTMTKYQPGGPSAEDHCPICMGEYCDGEDLVCPPCGHVLHGACLFDWFMHGPRPTCPCCRIEYALDVVKG